MEGAASTPPKGDPSKSDEGESVEAIKKIFNKLDIKRDGFISADELKTVMRALHMFPPSKKLKEIIADVDVDGDGVISFDEFVRMRRSNQATELNVLAQFKKFDCSSLFRGFITEESLRKVLTEEGYSGSALEVYVANFMSSDTNGDGKVSYRDLFERMMSRIPQEWLAWIYENVNRGVSDKTIVKILLDNGFKQEIAQQLLERTKREGLLTVERTYADNNFGYIYQVRA